MRKGLISTFGRVPPVALVGVLLLPLAWATSPAAAAAATCGAGVAYTPPTGITASFNRIDTGTNGVRNQLLSLIKGANVGSSIHLAEYKLSDSGVTQALVDAHCRGVNVRIILDSGEVGNSSWTTLTSALGQDTTASSWITHCPSGEACLSHDSSGDGSINHNKFAIFSSVGTAKNVVFQMTMNLNSNNEALFNDAVMIVPSASDTAATTYNNYDNYFVKMKAHAPASSAAVPDYFNPPPTGAGPSDSERTDSATNTKIYFSPRPDYGSPKATDTMLNLLQNVDCSRDTQQTVGDDGKTAVRVGMSEWNDVDIADQLKSMQEAGCDVNVIFRSDNDSAVIKDLTKSIPSGHGQLTLRYFCDPNVSSQPSFHDKFAYVGGNYGGGASNDNRTLVFMGSLNYITKALRSNDNVLLKIENSSVYASYKSYFQTLSGARGIHSISTTANGVSSVPGCNT